MGEWTVAQATRVLGVLAICLAFAVLNVTSASAACGQTIDVSPQHSLGPGPAPLAVGDSVLYDAAPVLSNYGFRSNAMVCRTMAQGIVWLQRHAGALPGLVAVALGTNGAVTNSQLDQLLGLLGPNRILALVTPHRGNYAYVPGLYRTAAQQYPGRIEVLDWDGISAAHPEWFAPDGIHLGGTAGVNAFASMVAGSLSSAPAPVPAPQTTPAAPPPTLQTAPATSVKPSNPHPLARAVDAALVVIWAAGADWALYLGL
jgi:hypothetical protein